MHLENFYISYHTQKENAAWKLIVFTGTATVLAYSSMRILQGLEPPKIMAVFAVGAHQLFCFARSMFNPERRIFCAKLLL